MKKDLYKILGVDKGATVAEISANFRDLAKKYHPDIARGDTAEKFIEIKKAYEVLKDPVRRSEYDRVGFNDEVDNPIDALREIIFDFTKPYQKQGGSCYDKKKCCA